MHAAGSAPNFYTALAISVLFLHAADRQVDGADPVPGGEIK